MINKCRRRSPTGPVLINGFQLAMHEIPSMPENGIAMVL